MRNFKVTWIHGYGENDGKSEKVHFNDLDSYGLDAYIGDEWKEEFLQMQIGEVKEIYGPDGFEEVHYERIS
jgi:hypothetical protein